MRKRFFTLLLTLCMVLTLFPFTAAAYVDESGTFVYSYMWTTDGNGVCIDGFEKGVSGAVTIPETLDGEPVIAVELDNYMDNTITSLTIPAGVRRLDLRGAHNLKSVSVSADNPYYTSIDGVVFNKDCTILEEFPRGRGGSYTVPGGVLEIGSHSFRGCHYLRTVTLPASVNNVDAWGFIGCSTLKAFHVAEENPSYTVEDGVLFDRSMETLIAYPCGKGGSYTVPSGVRTIDDGAFYDCEGCGEITIPEGVTTLGSECFRGCDAFRINVPASISYVGCSVFSQGSYMIYYAGSPDQWNELRWHDASGDKLAYYNVVFATGGSSIYDAATNQVAPVVYENKKDSNNESPSYRLSEGATIQYQQKSYQTDKNGTTELNYQGGSIIVQKEGYSTRRLSQQCLLESSNVYLQKESKYPVINAVWLDGKHDVLHETYTLPLVQKNAHSLSAEVDWGASSAKSVHLYQDGKTLSLLETQSVVLSDSFDLSKAIYIVATNTDGLTNTQKMMLKSGTSNTDILSGTTIEFGDKLEFTLPDSVPVIGGQSLSIGEYSNIPVKCVLENGKVYVAIGIQIDQDDDDGIKSYVNSVKKMKANMDKVSSILEKNKTFQDALKSFGKQAAEVESSFGVDAGVKALGFAEGYYDESGNLQWLDGGIVIGANIGVDYSAPFSIGPVPCYFEVKFGGDFEAQLNLFMSENAKKFMPTGVISGDVSVNVGAGVGINKVASVGGGGKGKLSPTVNYQKASISSAEVKFSFNFYVKATLAGFEVPYEFDPLIEKVIYRYPNEASAMLAEAQNSYLSRLYDLSEYRQQDLSYLESGSTFVANEVGGADAMSYSALESLPFLNNAYQQSAPQIVALGGGTRLAVWKGYDSTRSGVNGLALYYSYYNGTTWSDPILVDSDDTGDGNFTLKVVNDTAYLAWQNMSVPAADDAQLVDVLAQYDISAAVFDTENCRFSVASISGENGSLDMLPTICGKDGCVTVVWLNNSSNDCFSSNSTGSILSCSLEENSWGEPQTLYSELGYVDSLVADYSGDGELQVYYCMDCDGDATTTDDFELFKNGSQYTSNSRVDSGVSIINGSPCWFGGDGLRGAYSISGVETDRYQILDGNDVTAVLFTQNDGVKSRLVAVFNDGSGWGNPLALTDGTDYVESFSGYIAEDGQLEVMVNCVDVGSEDAEGDPYGQADLQILTYNMHSELEITDVYYASENYVSNDEIPAEVSISNNGTVSVKQFCLEMRDENGEVIYSENFNMRIRAGETKSVITDLKFSKPEQDKVLTVLVSATDSLGGETVNTSTFSLHQDDLAVENLGWGISDDGTTIVHADIVNRGYTASGDVTVSLHKGTVDGAVVGSKSLTDIQTLDLQHVAFPIDGHESNVYFLTIDTGVEDDNAATDQDFIVLLPEQGASCEHEFVMSSQPATCESDGYEIKICQKCGESIPVRIDSALGHEWKWVVDQNATDTESGLKHEECTRCGVTRNEGTVIPAGHVAHDYRAEITAPTCTEQGYTTHTCACGDRYVDDYVDALGHDFGAWTVTKESTCTKEGECVRACSRCDAVETEVIPALGHDFGEWTVTKEATCTQEGECTRACSRCDAAETEAIPALGHQWDDGVVTTEPTATKDGVKTFTCTVCGETRTEAIPATSVCDGGEACPSRSFSDVQAHWGHLSIDYCVKNGLMNGMGNGKFDPEGTLTRAMLATILWRQAGEPKATKDCTFTDLGSSSDPAASWYLDAVAWAAEVGVVNGYPDGTFAPSGAITRQEMATMLYRYAGIMKFDTSAKGDLSVFPDENQVLDYAVDAMIWANGAELITGDVVNDVTCLNPLGNATRAQVATILMRFCENVAK